MRIFFCSIVLLFFTNCLSAQDRACDSPLDSLLSWAREHYASDLKQAVYFADCLIEKAEDDKNYLMLYEGHFVKGVAFSQHQKTEKILDQYLSAQIALCNLPDDDKTDKLKILLSSFLGTHYFSIGNFQASEKYFQEIIDEFNAKEDLTDDQFGQYLNWYTFLADMCTQRGEYDNAFDHYQYIIESDIDRGFHNTDPFFDEIYCNLASAQLMRKNYAEAIENFEIGIPVLTKHFENAPDYEIPFYGGLLSSFYTQYADCHLQLNQPNLAITLLEKALTFPTSKKVYYAKAKIVLGKTYASIGKDKQALSFFQQANDEMHQFYKGKKHADISMVNLAMGDFYFDRKNIEDALENYQAALINLCPDFDNVDRLINPTIPLNINNDLIHALRKKTIALNKLATLKKDDGIKKTAFKTGSLAVDWIQESIRSSTINNADIINKVSEHYSLYEELISIGCDLGKDYHKDIFDVLEKSKSVALLKFLNDKSALSSDHISPDTLNEFYVLKHQIKQDEELLFSLQTPTPTNERKVKLDSIGIQLCENKEELKILKEAIDKSLDKNNPISTIDLATIQQNLDNDECILEYFIGDQQSFVFLIKHDTFVIEKLNLKEDDILKAGQLKERIVEDESPERYIQDAQYLYRKLVAPVESYLTKNDHLIIIPDGALYYVPFEALLYNNIATGVNYSSFPYLIRNHSFSYSFSSTLLYKFEQKNHKTNPTNSLLALAPSFRNMENDKILVGEDSVALEPLENNVDEISKISQWVTSDTISSNASLKYFLHHAGNYRFIHLATHAIVNDLFPEFSFTAFSNITDTVDRDFKLISNNMDILTLNADMVVLSACDTGVGKVYKGEGIISIARGFIEAGTKSIVTTLWSINDVSTPKLMNSFYKHLSSNNISKAVALKEAKLELIEDEFLGHPRFWAAFVAYGDMSSVDQVISKPWSICYCKLCLCFLIAIIVLWIGRKLLKKKRA